MPKSEAIEYKSNSPYADSGALTREQYLFKEMRIVAKMRVEGLTDEEIIEKIYRENIFQYPTEKMLRNIARACLRRLKALNTDALVKVIALGAIDEAKQVCLYAMMQQNRLVRDFMIKVIGEKYSNRDYNFKKTEVNSFLLNIQEQDLWVASWSDSTVNKIRQVIVKTLVDNDYLDSHKSEVLNTITIKPVLENVLREKNPAALVAFNCLY